MMASAIWHLLPIVRFLLSQRASYTNSPGGLPPVWLAVTGLRGRVHAPEAMTGAPRHFSEWMQPVPGSALGFDHNTMRNFKHSLRPQRQL
jgi:hypothetical protein